MMRHLFAVSKSAALGLILCLASSAASAQLFGPLPAYAADAPDAELAPGYKRPSDAQAHASAKALIQAMLKDPASGRFSPLSRKKSKNGRGLPVDVVCGTIDGKKPSGQYGGPKPFVYFVARKEAVISKGKDVQGVIVKLFCDPPKA